MIYFGPLKDLQEDGKAFELSILSMEERYSYDLPKAGFFFNDDKKCTEDQGLDRTKNYIVFANGEGSKPLALDVDEEMIDFEVLQSYLNI